MSQHQDIECVIFDCDGVLVDSEVLSQKVLLALLQEKGVNVDTHYFIAHFLGRNFDSVTAKVLEDFGVVLDEKFRLLFRERLFHTFDTELVATAHIQSMLSAMTLPKCVATSSSPPRVTHALEVTGLNTYFDTHVFSTSLVAHGKPAPDIFLYAAEQMGADPKRCLVIEDSLSGIKAGLAAQMQVVQFNGATHMQHFGTSSMRPDIPAVESWAMFTQAYPQLFHPA